MQEYLKRQRDVSVFGQLFGCWLAFVHAKEADRERRCEVFCEERNWNLTETKIFLVRRTEKISRPTNKQTNKQPLYIIEACQIPHFAYKVCRSIAPAEISNTPRWQFGPLEDNEWGGCSLDPKKSRREIFQRIFALGIFWDGVGRYAATPLIVALSPGHSDITRFRPWSPIATENHMDRAEKKIKICSESWHRWRLWSAFRHFGTHIKESFRMSTSSWMMDPTHWREIPSCAAIYLADIRRSLRISSWIWSIIYGVVTVLGRPGRGASQVAKSPRLNWATQF